MQFMPGIMKTRMADSRVTITVATVNRVSKAIARYYPSLKRPTFRWSNPLTLPLLNASSLEITSNQL